jgi:hypothetical protein
MRKSSEIWNLASGWVSSLDSLDRLLRIRGLRKHLLGMDCDVIENRANTVVRFRATQYPTERPTRPARSLDGNFNTISKRILIQQCCDKLSLVDRSFLGIRVQR